MKPLIGVSTYGSSHLQTNSRYYERHYAVPADYIDAVRRAGGATVLLSPGEDSIERWLVAVDGVLFTGGTDVDPDTYGGDAADSRIRAIDRERDDQEIALTRATLDAGIPALFICRGLQVLNVALGGSLLAHLPDIGEGGLHRDAVGGWTNHVVEVESESRLAAAMGTAVANPASAHHQAVDRVGEGLDVVAVAPDGVIEGLEVANHPWAVAVQWHPEITAAEDARQQGIFESLVRAAQYRCACG